MADRRRETKPAPRREPLPPPEPPQEQLSLLEEVPARPRAKSRHAGAERVHRGPRFGEQFDLFPVKPVVEALDPRVVAGGRTRVQGIWRVTIGKDDPHMVYRDRHGTYCEAHGPGCRAVRVVMEKP
jgi:hypothetical protein